MEISALRSGTPCAKAGVRSVPADTAVARTVDRSPAVDPAHYDQGFRHADERARPWEISLGATATS
jgi:hypothetical protein